MVAFSADYGKLWIVLRPPAGAPGVNRSLITLTSVLGGSEFIDKLKAENAASGADTSSDTGSDAGAVANSGRNNDNAPDPGGGVSDPATDPTDPGSP